MAAIEIEKMNFHMIYVYCTCILF